MKLPAEAISEYQGIYEIVVGKQISQAEANINAEMLLTLIFSLENNSYKKSIIKQKNESRISTNNPK